MGQDAGLRRHIQPLAQVVEQAQEVAAALRAVAGGIDADHRVTAAEHEAVEGARQHALGIVGRMVGLDARGQPAGEPEGVAEAGDDPALRGDDDQVLVAADLGDGRGHFRCDAGGRGGKRRGR